MNLRRTFMPLMLPLILAVGASGCAKQKYKSNAYDTFFKPMKAYGCTTDGHLQESTFQLSYRTQDAGNNDNNPVPPEEEILIQLREVWQSIVGKQTAAQFRAHNTETHKDEILVLRDELLIPLKQSTSRYGSTNGGVQFDLWANIQHNKLGAAGSCDNSPRPTGSD